MKIKDRAKPKVPPVEAGVYMAVCVGFIDLGEQYSEKFKNYSYKGLYVWELPRGDRGDRRGNEASSAFQRVHNIGFKQEQPSQIH